MITPGLVSPTSLPELGTFAAGHIGRTARLLLRPGEALTLRATFSRAAHAVTARGELVVLADDDVAAPWAVGVPGLLLPLLASKSRSRLIVSADNPAHLSLAGITIDLGQARSWASPPPQLSRAAAHAQDMALRASALPATAPGLAECGAGPLVDALAEALARGDQAAVAAACAPLVGLGRGLTPAGDDLVAGALGVVALAGRPCLAPPLAGRTTLLGATQVAHAAAGALVEPLHAIVAALLAGAPPPAAALRRTLALGHSSGADMLAGVQLAVAALARKAEG